jgi:hypothetical protein
VSLSSSFEDLELDRKQAELGFTFPSEPTALKEFKVLRRQERTLAGLRGQEFITRTTLNNGHVYYSMAWGTKGAEGDALTPQISVGLNTPKDTVNSKGAPYTPVPPEAQLIALWDGALATLRIRPGALPAGQVLRSVN